MTSLGLEWRKKLPRIPLTREEIKATANRQREQDGIRAMQLLDSIQSEPAGIIKSLQLSKEIVKTAMSILRDKHAEQINLISILSGTRFKFHFH